MVIRTANGDIIAEATIAGPVGRPISSRPPLRRVSRYRSGSLPRSPSVRTFDRGEEADPTEAVLAKPIATLSFTMKSAGVLEVGDSGKVDLGSATRAGAFKPLNCFAVVQCGVNAVAMKEIASAILCSMQRCSRARSRRRCSPHCRPCGQHCKEGASQQCS